MKFVLCLIMLLSFAFGEWQMFADKQDTYIYNTITGEIYIRYRAGKENYKDMFIKMPQGVVLTDKSVELGLTKPAQQDLQLESVKKAQEMMQKALGEN